MSQGAFTSMAALMHYPIGGHTLAGVFSLSGGVPFRPEGTGENCHALSLPPQVVSPQADILAKTPLFVWHGVSDSVMPFWTNLLYLEL